MSRPNPPPPVKLIVSLFSARESILEEVIERLSLLFGPIDDLGPRGFFDRSTYYAAEMGWPLHRRYASFERLIQTADLVAAKIATNALEKESAATAGRRRVNIDPGILSVERLILATGKNFTHRVYLSQGIYADLTLIFQKGSFRPLEWTYPDYADPVMIEWLNAVRRNYREQLRGEKNRD